MKTCLSGSRRQFISGLATITAAGLLPYQNNAIASNQLIERSGRMNTLIKILQEHRMRRNDVFHDEQKANFLYAFDKIKPLNHLEETIAVACSMSCQPVCDMVDEYIRRKHGISSRLPEIPIHSLNNWGVPDTYRVLIFRDQINALISEITGQTLRASHNICNEIMCGHIKDTDFASYLSDKYQWFSRDDVTAVYDAVVYFAPTGRPYTWCSTMVDRADTISERQ